MCIKVEESKQAREEDGAPDSAAAAVATTTREKIKNGVHIIWPNVTVNPDIAWMLRAWLLYELTTHAEELSPLGELCEPWEKVIDPCVFGKNGLRMIWSRKASTCKVCNGVPFQRWISEKRQRSKGMRGPAATETVVKRPDISPCKTCNTFDNKVDEGRPYDPIAVVDCEEAEAETLRLSNPLVALEMTSIRVVSAEVGITPFKVPDQMVKLIEPWRKKTIKEINQMRPPASDDRTTVKRKRKDDKTVSSLVPVSPGDKAYAVLSEYVTSVLNCGIVSMKTDEFKHFYLVNTNSHECKNKGGTHGRSTVYLLFQPDGYYQKCWCRKGDIYRPGGVSCENYRSPLIQYITGDVSEIRQLFSARFAHQFPFTFGQPAPQILSYFGPSSSSSSSSQMDTSDSKDPFSLGPRKDLAPSGPLLIDSYPELKGRKFSEVKKIIEERMKAWREAQSTIKDRDEKKDAK